MKTPTTLYPEAAEAFFDARGISGDSTRTYGNVYEQLQARHPRMHLAGFTAAVIEDFLLYDTEGRERGLSPHTIRNYTNALRVLFAWATEAGHISRNPMDQVTLRGSRERVREPAWLTLEDIHTIVESSHGEEPADLRDCAILSMIGYSCVKPSALVRWRWPAGEPGRSLPPGFDSPSANQALLSWGTWVSTHSPKRWVGTPAFCPINPNGVPSWGRGLTLATVRGIVQRRAEQVGFEAVQPDDLRRSMVGYLWTTRQYLIRDMQEGLGLEAPESVLQIVKGYPWPPEPIPVQAPF